MKKITVVTVGNVCHDLMRFSLENTLKHTPDVEDVLVIADRPILDHGRFHALPQGFTRQDYSKILLKDLYGMIKTEFALICQYDGMAVDAAQWRDDFYQYDYIGAPWPERFHWIPKDSRVGNGGFSLRSARLLEALQNSQITTDDNEDVLICQIFRKFLTNGFGIKYAPIELANGFSNEWNNPEGSVFGFHGIFNFPRYFSDQLCAELMAQYTLNHWYDDQLQNFLEFCEANNYIQTLLQLEKNLSSKTQ